MALRLDAGCRLGNGAGRDESDVGQERSRLPLGTRPAGWRMPEGNGQLPSTQLSQLAKRGFGWNLLRK
jgi:hypothetical protein